MKATEIQIGDRLAYRGQYNAFDFRVEQVTKHKVGYHAEPGENRMHYLRLHEVQPIPITAEILERNGFNKDSGGEESWGSEDGWMVPNEYDDSFKEISWQVEILGEHNTFNGIIKFVHQLQHALRLCGIEKEIEL